MQPQPSWRVQAQAFAVHIFTAAGAALALGALLYATRADWGAMFLCLGIALIIDAVDGTFARHFKVAEVLPRWSGDVLDFVVDFVTYVFVPAYAITAGHLLPEALALPSGLLIVITGAIYFADRQMKAVDNYFRGFPALWNLAAFYLFLMRPAPWATAAFVVVLAALTFAPFKFVHPVRVARLRPLNLALLVLWSMLALIAVLRDFEPGSLVVGGLVLIAVYFVAVGLSKTRVT